MRAHPLFPVLVLLIACGSGENEGPEPTGAPSSLDQSAPAAPPPIEGEFRLGVDGVDMTFGFFPRTRNFARGQMVVLRAMPTQGSDEGMTLQVHGFDLRGATLPVTLGNAQNEAAVPENVPEEAAPDEAVEVLFGYWRGGLSYGGSSSVVFESFEGGVLIGRADDLSIQGSGLANGQETLFTDLQFRVALPTD